MAEPKCGLCSSESVSCMCACTSPQLHLCTACILPHISTPGSHVMKSFSAVPSKSSQLTPDIPANELCSLCLSGLAENICSCGKSETVFCVKCVPIHTSKAQEEEHVILPLKARAFISRPEYVDRLKRRQISLQKAIGIVSKSLLSIETCKSSLHNIIEGFLQKVTQYEKAKNEELASYESLLTGCLKQISSEISENIFNDDYAPLSEFASSVWACALNHETLFNYKPLGQYRVKFYKSLNSNLSFTQAKFTKKQSKQKGPKRPARILPISTTPIDLVGSRGPLEASRTLARVLDGHLCLYDCETWSCLKRFEVSEAITSLSSVLFLPNGNIFISGKENPASASAWEICSDSGQVMQISDMLTPRYGHGTIYSSGIVYVLGGTSLLGHTANCEALEMDNKQWSRLASLQQARDFFNPCLYEHFIFIIGGRKTSLCERYSIPQNIFTCLPFQAPKSSQCTTALSNNSILYICRKIVMKWSLQNFTLEWQGTLSTSRPCSGGWSVQNPILIGNTLHILKPHAAGMIKIELPSEAVTLPSKAVS